MLNSQKYATIMKLAAPPKWGGVYPKPVLYFNKTKNKKYFILSPHCCNSRDIYKYDIQDNEYSILCSYPKEFNPNCHGQVFIPETNDLYFVCGHELVLGILNLETLKWTIKCANERDKLNINIPQVPNPHCIYIQSSTNPIHIFGTNLLNSRVPLHAELSSKSNVFIQHGIVDVEVYLSTTSVQQNVIFSNAMQKIFIFDVNWNHDIICCNIHQNQKTYEWKTFTELPCQEMGDFHVISVFNGYIIVLFEYNTPSLVEKTRVWCLDVETKHWVKLNATGIDDIYTDRYLRVIKHEHLLHVIVCREEKHWAIDLFNIIPHTLILKCKKRFDTLAYGYIRKFELNLFNNFPNDIVLLIAEFSLSV
eukprot:319837_1